MARHNQLEMNVIESFKLAKRDIIRLQSQLIELANKQEALMSEIDSLKDKENNLYNRVTKIKDKPARKVIIKRIVSKPLKVKAVKKVKRQNKFVASKDWKKFHIPACPFAKNIKPKSKVVFKTKNVALNKGYKPCHCAER